MKASIVVAMALIMLYLTGCAAVPPVKTQFESVRTYDKDFDVTWEAVIESFAETNTPIKNVDKNSGIIVAEMMKVPYDVDYRSVKSAFCDCGTPRAMLRYVGLVGNFNVFVKRFKDEKVSVRVNSSFVTQLVNADGRPLGTIDCEPKGFFEKKFFERLEQKF